MENDELDGLDVSWMSEQQRINSTEILQKREPMQKIKLCFIYINKSNYIENILHDVEILDGSIISNERILHIIQNKKVKTSVSKFKLSDILLYHIDLEPEVLQSFVQKTESSSSYLKPISIINDIKVPDSIFVFHNINKLYFLFKEVEVKCLKKPQTLKSILKPVSVVGPGSRPIGNTKKVRISMVNHTTRKVIHT